MPKRRKSSRSSKAPPRQTAAEESSARVRPIWTGTITFGLVSIPVELLTSVRARETAMKLVDEEGHPLGRRYFCSKEDKKLDQDDLIRGYETDDGKMVVISDEEFESVAPEMSPDIELRNFVPLEQIPPLYFSKPYFLAPTGKSSKAYNLLAATMEQSGKVGIGSFVMRGHEYLVAILSDNGVLRADTLRYSDEIRTPEMIGLPERGKGNARKVTQFSRAIDELLRKEMDPAELEDEEAEALHHLVEAKRKKDEDVVSQAETAEADSEEEQGGGNVIDLMAVLRKSLSKNAVVKNAAGATPISLAEHRA
ncbi:MAG TPA: Ku protein, partial [Steroidobacteraceae bacterium]|nr:Ku protein [Steroidobacteraceae bacterium]